jgi:hypothetical protein
MVPSMTGKDLNKKQHILLQHKWKGVQDIFDKTGTFQKTLHGYGGFYCAQKFQGHFYKIVNVSSHHRGFYVSNSGYFGLFCTDRQLLGLLHPILQVVGLKCTYKTTFGTCGVFSSSLYWIAMCDERNER